MPYKRMVYLLHKNADKPLKNAKRLKKRGKTKKPREIIDKEPYLIKEE